MSDNPCNHSAWDTGWGHKSEPMLTAYVAAPYRGDTAWAVHCNIHAASVIGAELWAMGIAAFIPHSNTAHMDGVVPEQVFLAGDLEFIRRGTFDIVVMGPGWECSEGAKAERALAQSLGIPVYCWPADEDILRGLGNV